MFKKILIANRGEIAVRVIRACKELGIKTVAVYSEADKDSLHTGIADEAVCIGSAPSSESYLNVFRILSAAQITGCDAIHPGYGFLAENADFAEACISSGIKFIGPKPEHIRAMGDKILAKKTMREAGVPTVPGSEGGVKSVKEVKEIVDKIGLPVILKAAAGGGGRGMRIVREKKDVEVQFQMAQAESKIAFGDDRVYVEKFIEKPRHIEVQLLGDKEGNVIHLAERECSIQRRHQKLIEEAPSPFVNQRLRKKITEAAVKGAKKIGYENAGTMEFLMDEEGNFYFMEMNTRVQVEHPITEIITDTDIVKLQIMIASGEPIGNIGGMLKFNRHAIECRINAENPEKGFMPTPGKIKILHLPGGPGIRVDTHIYAGYTIPPHYDSLIAKVISYGNTREEARKRMIRALDEFYVEGVKTTIPFHLKVLNHPEFIKGNLSTRFIEEYMKEFTV